VIWLMALIAWLVRGALATIDQYNALAGVTLERGMIQGQSLTTGQTVTMDIPCGGTDFVTVEADMTGTAIGDLGITVTPYAGDSVTLMGAPLQPVLNVGTTAAAATVVLAGGHCYQVVEYNVQGIDKVRLSCKNNNAATQTLTRLNWRTANF